MSGKEHATRQVVGMGVTQELDAETIGKECVTQVEGLLVETPGKALATNALLEAETTDKEHATKIVVLDVETTGKERATDQIIELCLRFGLCPDAESQLDGCGGR